NGFLMRHGYTVAWVGWQPDVPRQDGLMALTVPRVTGVSGRIRCEFRPNTPAASLPLADRYHIPHPVARPDDPEHELTVRAHTGAPEMPVPPSAWRFARVENGKLVADPSHVALDGGFEPGKIYDCYYRAVDPPVVGLGFVAVRDAAAFLRFGTAPGNPCASQLDRAYVFGVSQSGRFLRHLLYLGLDEDETGRAVFDAVIPHVAGARRGEFNCRFGQPSLNALHSIGCLFPFTDVEQEDPVTGQRGSLLERLYRRGGGGRDIDHQRPAAGARRGGGGGRAPASTGRGGAGGRWPRRRTCVCISSRAPSTRRARSRRRRRMPTPVDGGGISSAPSTTRRSCGPRS